MKKLHSGSHTAVLLIACLVTLGGVALASDQPDSDDQDIQVTVVRQCGSDDCDGDKRVHKIMIDADGEVHGLDGDAFAWVSSDGEKRIRIKKILKDCDGDDCDDQKKRFHKIMIDLDGEVHEMHGDGGESRVWFGGHPGKHFRFRTGHGGGGFLGVNLTELTPELRQHFGVPAGAGVMVSKVVDDSPAMKAGLQAGDIVTGVGGETVGSGRELARQIRKQEDGAVVTLEVWRDGRMQLIDAMVEQREGPDRMAYAFGPSSDHSVDLDCSDGDGDCHVLIEATEGYDEVCEGQGECKVQIKCQGEGDCECTVNDEAMDCESLPGYNVLHGK